MNVKPVMKRKAQKRTGFIIAQKGKEVGRGIPDAFRKTGAKSKNIREGVEVAKEYCCASTQ